MLSPAITYIIAVVLVIILLIGAVCLHLLFGFHRLPPAKAKVSRISHTRNLHNHLFGKY